LIFSIGDIMIDAYFSLPGPLNPRTDTRGCIELVPGGSAANFAVWVSRLGAQSAFVGRVGDDFLGSGLKDDLVKEGVKPYLARDPSLGTGRVGVLVSETGERDMVCDRRANATLCEADVPCDDIVALASWVHISGYALFEAAPRAAARRAIDVAVRAGVPVSVDPSSYGFIRGVGAEAFLEMCRGASVILPNLDEGIVLTGTDDPEQIVSRLSNRFPVVALKLGARGSLGVASARTSNLVSAEPVDTIQVDTNGAGDAFNAGFVVEYLRGTGLAQALRRGNELGALAVSRRGAR
jgi:sugar/nucleoside kinase (ribokinase family)